MIDLRHLADQVASLERFTDLSLNGAGVGGALRAGLAPVTMWELREVSLSEPDWEPTTLTWARDLRVSIRDHDGTDLSVHVPVPWLVDDACRAAAPPGVGLGAHQGTFAGRPRIPVTELVRTPGIRAVVRPRATGPEAVIEIVPTFGTPWHLRIVNKRTRRVEARGGGVRRWRSDPQNEGEGNRKRTQTRFALDDLAGLHDLLADHPFDLPVDILDRDMESLVGQPRRSSGEVPITVEDLQHLVPRLLDLQEQLESGVEGHAAGGLPRGMLTELDPGARHLARYGDMLVGAAWRGARAAAVRIVTQHPDGPPTNPKSAEDDRLILARRLRIAFAEVARGEGAHTNAAVSERPRNTLALLEAHRQVTFLGPDGLPELRGRMDLRTLPPSWKDTLCPVHTPESDKVGLVRYLALGATGAAAGNPPSTVLQEFPDLSLGAALVPFVGHNDPTRTSIVAKMFKQALVVAGAEPPVVRTGLEEFIAAQAGVLRAPHAGPVHLVDAGHLTVGATHLYFGPPSMSGSGQDLAWTTVAAHQAYARADSLLAHAPDVNVQDPAAPCLQLGLNAVVAFVPWHGWNYEDGMVVSEGFAQRTTSEHVVRIAVPYDRGDPSRGPDIVIESLAADQVGDMVPAGTMVAVIAGADGTVRSTISFPEDTVLVPNDDSCPFRYVDLSDDEISVRFRVRRTLRVGDKLTTRHGGKGVVNRILPVVAMPRLPDGTPVEVILNPLGVLRRLNIGTILEANVALARRLRGQTTPAVAPRRLGQDGRHALRDELAGLGAPGGRLPLTLVDGTPVGPPEGAVVGDLYLLKLDHLATSKAGGRDEAGPSPINLQPARSSGWRSHRKIGAPQRLGEMEVWALQAIGAHAPLLDLLHHRGVGTPALRDQALLPAGLRAALAHLAVAGVHVEGVTADGTVDLTTARVVDPAAIGGLRVRWCGAGDPGDLTDIDTLREAAAERLPKRVGERRRAAAMLDIALTDPWWAALLRSSDVESALDTETAGWVIRLAKPVRHPWWYTVQGREVRLPALENVAVLPPALFLPPTAGRDGDVLRRRYTDLLTTNLLLAQAIANGNGETELQSVLQRNVNTLLGTTRDTPADGTIAGRLSGKYGILRRNLLGASAIRSGRAVLTGDPTQPIETVGLPGWLLADLGVPASPQGHDDVVLLNRQPTLHPYSLVALRAVESPDTTVRIHPYLLKAIAGDFDGDTAAVHRPVDAVARAELWDRCRPAATLRNSNSGGLLAKLDLDIAVGLHLRSLTPQDRASLARDLDLACPDTPLLPADNTALADRLVDGAADPTAALTSLAKLMQAGWDGAPQWGFTVVDLPDLPGPDVVTDVRDTDNPSVRRIAQAHHAGAGGKPIDLTQLLLRRGLAAPPHPYLPTVEIAGNYLNGLDNADYFAAAQPAVAALAAKKLVTPHAGALTRRLVEIGYEVVIDGADCGSTATRRSPLTCLQSNPCQACYGVDAATGQPPSPGRRVGVLAGMLIGEQSTQLAVKSIHQRGQNSTLTASIAQLAGVFGGGRFAAALPAADDDSPGAVTARALLEEASAGRTTLGDTPAVDVDLARLLGAAHPAAVTLAEALEPALTRFESLLGPAVRRAHAEVLLRPFLDAYRAATGSSDDGRTSLTLTELRGRLVTGVSGPAAAARRGSLTPIIHHALVDDDAPVTQTDAHQRAILLGTLP